MDEALARALAAFAARGLTLSERLGAGVVEAAPSAGPVPGDPGASALLDDWRGRLAKLGLWTERLGALGVPEDRFLACAAAHADVGDCQFGSAVRRFLDAVLSLARARPAATRRYPHGLPPLPPALEHYVVRYVSQAMREADPIPEERCVDLAHLVVQETDSILSELHDLLLPSLVTEMHVATGLGMLAGDSPEARFASFCRDCLPAVEWLAQYFETYPVAARLAQQLVRVRCAAFVELLRRLRGDYGVLAEAGFFGDAPVARPRLHAVSPALGDHHRGGRAVRMLELTGGIRLMNKPRCVTVDLAFQALAAWLNAEGFEPPLYVMPIVERPGYGWFPFLARQDCDDQPAVGRFYRRHGAHMTLLYLLGGYDFFYDNVRAFGEYPVLVDLECVHAPLMPAYNGRLFDSAARRYLEESVYRAGMLPAWNWVYLGDQGVNLSALTLTDGQEVPQDLLDWTDRGTDRLHQERVRKLLRTDHPNLSTLDGVPVPVDDFMSHLFGGFRDAYRIIERNKTTLLAPGSVLTAFGAAECRLVLRNTVDYRALTGELRHPRYLGDGLRYSDLLDRLWVSRCPRYTPRAIDSEIEQLWAGDVPVFATRGDSRALCDHRGQVVDGEYFEESALDGARRRLARFGPDDCERQVEIMNCAFAVTDLPHVADRTLVQLRSVSPDAGIRPPTDSELISEASQIANRILDLAIEDERTLTWIGLGANRVGQWDQTSLDSGLYDGGPGIALFLLALHRATGVARYADAYRKIVQYVCIDASREVLKNRDRLEAWVIYPPTGFTFPFSALYLSTHVEHAGEPAGIETVLDATLRWGEVGLGKKARSDFLNGAAGMIRVLLIAYRVAGDPRALALARTYGEQLLDNAVPSGPGLGWRSEQYPVPLGGFSHGAAGVAWVLAELAQVTGDERFMQAAEAALRFDRSLFSADRDEWFDLRFGPAQPGDAVQWCHGVAGIGLGRALLWRHRGGEDIARDARRAVDITLDTTLERDCLCHGSMGNIECCAIAAESMRDAAWRDRVYQKAATTWRAVHRRGHWDTGVPGRSIGICGLFMGTAGIGLALLRLARPGMVPSVLFLEDPKA